MTKSAFFILLLILVGGAGAFFLWDRDDAVELAIVEAEAPLEDDLHPPDAAEMNATESLASGVDGVDTALPDGLAELMREEVESEVVAARILLLQVWDRKKGVPAVDTDVFFLDGFDGPELKDPFAQHWSEFAEAKGQRFKTDLNGRVELPAVTRWAMVTAQHSGAFGFAKVGRRHGKVQTITLREDETVTVRVVDEKRHPVVGAPVGIVQTIPVREQKEKWQTLMAQMKQLERAAARVEKQMRDNPALAERMASRMSGIRARQGRLKQQMVQLKGGGRKGARQRGRKKTPRVAKTPGKKQPKYTISTRPEVRARRRTDKDGVAVIRHFQIYRENARGWWPSPHVDQFEAVLLMPLSKPQSVAFSGRPVPSETIELSLPPTGSIALRTVDLDGRPYTHAVHATLGVRTKTTAPWSQIHVRKAQNESEIVFPFVGLGLEFTAQCRLDDDDFRWNLAPFMGPGNPGERVTLDLVVAPKAGMLFGRLLDVAGEPLAGLRPSFLINTSAGRLEGEDVTTDAQGRFHLPYQVRDHHRAPYRLEIRRNEVRPVAGLAMPLQGLPVGGITDLGDLRLDAFAAVAHGVVVDDRGQPVSGAVVQLQRQRDVGKNQQTRTFVDEAFVVAKTSEEGGYELFARLESARYRLRVQARNHFPFVSQDLRPGAQLDPELLRNSKVVGTVLTPAWLPSRDLRVVLQSVVDAKQRREDRIHDYMGKKFVYFDRVRPGVYSVSIRLRSFPDPILRIAALQIEPGKQDLHVLLKDLDLTSYLHRFEIAALDERGQSIKPDWPLIAGVVRPDGRLAHVGFKWRGAKVVVVSTSPQLEVWPMANGYRADRTILAPGANQLRFLKIPPVELNLPGIRRLVGEARVWIKLQSLGKTSSPQALATWDRQSGGMSRWFGGMKRREAGAILPPGDRIQIPLMLDGRYKVIAYLLGTTGKRRTRAVAVELGAVDVRLVAGAGPLRLAVDVDAKKMRDALAELTRRQATGGLNKRP
jgi:hypothetical protein